MDQHFAEIFHRTSQLLKSFRSASSPLSFDNLHIIPDFGGFSKIVSRIIKLNKFRKKKILGFLKTD
uniref:Uncharacterized protein n=1 Tax=Octopus bimaculoides TaxID=37653 RepID=A0A0L8HW42_OCTBM